MAEVSGREEFYIPDHMPRIFLGAVLDIANDTAVSQSWGNGIVQ